MPPENQAPLPPQQPNVPSPSAPPPSPASFPSQPTGSPQVVGPQHASGQPLFAPDNPALKSKKKLRLPKILLIVLLVLVLIGSGGGYAYWSMLNNRPEKVLADALGNTMRDVLARRPTTTIGSLDYTFKESGDDEPFRISIDFDVKQVNDDLQTGATMRFEAPESNVDITVEGAVIIMDTKELYVKFDNLEKTVRDIAAVNPEYEVWTVALQPIIEKIDGQWIKIDSESVAEAGLAEAEEIDACSEAFKKLRIKPEDEGKIKEIFSRNQFAIATKKLPKEKAGDEESFHYKLDLNERASIKFTKELVELSSFATLKQDCKIDQKEFDRQLKNLDEAEAERNKEGGDHEEEHPKPVIELWVGTETRLPTRLRIVMDDKEINTTFDTIVKVNAKDVDIKKPADAMSFTELMHDIEALNLGY